MNRKIDVGEFVAIKVGSYGQLLCPFCGETYTHHYRTTMYQTDGSDTGEGIVEQWSVGEFVDGAERNELTPSSRRDAVGIRFYCENCPELFEMCIAQHKGQTIVEVRRIRGRSHHGDQR